MAKRKTGTQETAELGTETVSSDSVQATEVGTSQEVSPLGFVVESEHDARALVEQFYQVPEGCQTVFVTSDRNVFWDKNENAAVTHALQNNLKLYRLTWH